MPPTSPCSDVASRLTVWASNTTSCASLAMLEQLSCRICCQSWSSIVSAADRVVRSPGTVVSLVSVFASFFSWARSLTRFCWATCAAAVEFGCICCWNVGLPLNGVPAEPPPQPAARTVSADSATAPTTRRERVK